MYYPFLRGRQNELLALRVLAEAGKLTHVIPVIEPVKASSTLLRTLKTITEKGCRALVVQNPLVGTFNEDVQADREFRGEYQTILYGSSGSLLPCYHADQNLTGNLGDEDLTEVAIILNHEHADMYSKIFRDGKPALTFVPDTSLRRKAKGESILIADHFKSRARNSDYPSDEEFFSDDNVFYSEEGYVGFSDYSIIGASFSEKGFLPRAVVVHLAFFKNDEEVWVRHFVSQSKEDTHDTAGKYYEAVSELVEWVSHSENVPSTHGLRELIRSHNELRFPGLGVLKRLSLMHHLEMMNDWFKR